jgi:hypothetical protein
MKKLITKKGLVEWLKVQALSSNPSTEKKKYSNHSPALSIVLLCAVSVTHVSHDPKILNGNFQK